MGGSSGFRTTSLLLWVEGVIRQPAGAGLPFGDIWPLDQLSVRQSLQRRRYVTFGDVDACRSECVR